MNFELRTDVLFKSLSIENLLSGLLAVLFKFPKDSSKTLGHSSSALSLKTKADLLNDLGRLNENEYKDLIMFMEIRNQLIHNLETDTLIKAAERCNKVKKLLEHNKSLQNDFSKYEDIKFKEGVLKLGFQELYGRILDFIEKLMKVIAQETEDEENRKTEKTQFAILLEITGMIENSVDTISKIYDNHVSGGEPEKLSQKDVLKRGVWGMFWKLVKEKYPDLYEIINQVAKPEN